MTAEEKLIANFYNGSFIEINSGDKDHIIEIMIEFAKYHVQEALKEACDKVEIHSHTSSYYSREFEEGIRTRSIYVPDNSILNAYPLNTIK